jgi:hypothetical protein
MQPEIRVTAYWYAEVHGLPCDLDYLMELGAQAARLARWEGIPQQKVLEGPSWVHTWPERVFDQVTRAARGRADAERAAPQQPQFYPPGSWAEAAHRAYDPLAVLPPQARPVSGPEAAILEIYRALPPGGGVTEEEYRILAGAYGPDEAIPPWCPEPRGEAARDMVTGNGRYATADEYGGLPWDGDDIR